MSGPPCILTIAGSDSGGGAGIQADLKTMTVLGAYGLSVVTALTAQNTREVAAIEAPSPGFVARQLQVVLDDFAIAACKTGMLFSREIIEALAPLLEKRGFPLVVDPVCMSQTGHQLLLDDAVAALVGRIIPLADLITPNKPEAELLAGMPISGDEDIGRCLERLLGLGPAAVLLKGGHFQGEEMVDWLALPGREPVRLSHRRIPSSHTHGTGCTLSAAIATHLGLGLPLEEAIRRSQDYLGLALTTGYPLGRGEGPPNHLAPLQRLRGIAGEAGY